MIKTSKHMSAKGAANLATLIASVVLAGVVGFVGMLVISGYEYFSGYSKDQAKPLTSLNWSKDKDRIDKLFSQSGKYCYASVFSHASKASRTHSENEIKQNVTLKQCYDSANDQYKEKVFKPEAAHSTLKTRFSVLINKDDTMKGICSFGTKGNISEASCQIITPTQRYNISY